MVTHPSENQLQLLSLVFLNTLLLGGSSWKLDMLRSTRSSSALSQSFLGRIIILIKARSSEKKTFVCISACRNTEVFLLRTLQTGFEW